MIFSRAGETCFSQFNLHTLKPVLLKGNFEIGTLMGQ